MGPGRASDVEDPSAGLIPSRDAAGSSPAAGLPNFPTRFAEDRSDMANSLEGVGEPDSGLE